MSAQRNFPLQPSINRPRVTVPPNPDSSTVNATAAVIRTDLPNLRPTAQHGRE